MTSSARRDRPRASGASRRSARATRPHRLRERVVCGVADEQMAEPNPSSPEQTGRGGRTPCERAPPSVASLLAFVGSEGLHGAAVEDLASIEPRSSTTRSSGSRWSSRAASNLDRRRHDDLRSGARPSIATISSTKSGFPPAVRGSDARRPSSQRSRESVVDQQLAGILVSGSSRRVTGQPGRRSRKSGRAQRQQDRGSLESRATCSTRSRKVSSPTGCRRGRRRAERPLSSSLRKAQAISSPDVVAVLAEERADRLCGRAF